jgi:hypothetical protein
MREARKTRVKRKKYKGGSASASEQIKTSNTKTKKVFKKPKCSLARNNNYTCYTKEALLKLRELWNARHPDVKIETTEPKEIWKLLRDNMINVCDRESCWLKQKFVDNNVANELLSRSFAPKSPKSWEKDPRTWLTSLDIDRVMKQYEYAHPNFMFIGPSPIDFDTKVQDGECVWDELCNFNLEKLLKKGKNKIGIVFNTDPHYKDGSHWISLFINVKEGYIFFFDSAGDKVPKEVKVLADRVIEQAKKLGITMKFEENHPRAHQKGNTECGMYSLFMITSVLKGKKKPKDFIGGDLVKDSEMEALRKEYFNGASELD